ncbi:RagB/SusD family nutrient uptake outer membrane protein [Pontibacter qinzhouensis]|uniref:RagB/SusD family nutrient uptake outer membrane protein n=1 Tax=Pontibacter qinzhouensis TaxID=2603253 RepID=A0A5C8K670_9BACT|nr:RagB/SusD family nutrient uptake outer membrane protein [Pontibacter qinzhouensis]TXK44304.1 RagB/SusD family nutrient uptake outer membrane protein [Pontibacter qinzhouensis]
MKRNFIYKSVLVVVALVASACDSWLELKPVNGIVRQDYWKTKEQVQSAVIGIYGNMLDSDLTEKLFLWGELRADMLMENSGIRFNEMEVINGNIVETNVIADWRPFYRIINYCNTVIELAPAVLEEDRTFTQQQLDGFLGEAYAIRGLMYFYLGRSFGDVPLKLNATISDDQAVALPKSSQAQVFNQVAKDLERAEQLAVLTYGNNAHNKGRITKYSVNAIQADLYLWKDQYDSARIACDKIINSGQFGLVQGSNNPQWFQQLYVQGNSSEAVFSLQFNAQKTNPFYSMFSTVTGRRFLAANRVLEDVFPPDPVDPFNVDIRSQASVRVSTGAVWKYLGFTLQDSRTLNDSYAHWIFYRFADVLLMKAEALVAGEMGRGEEALELIRRIRQRANASPNTDPTIDNQSFDPNAKEDMIDFILEERAREFAFEGKRWYDILRNARRPAGAGGAPYARQDILNQMVIDSAPSERQQSIINKYNDPNSHYWPIFQYELFTNKSLEQNPFYRGR